MNDFQRYLAEEFAEDYEDGRISRREALQLIVSVTGSLILANSILAGCTPRVEEAPAAILALEPTTTSVSQSLSTKPTAYPTTTSQANTASPTSDPSAGVTVAPDDPAIEASPVVVPAEGLSLMAYLARLKGGSARPVVLVCHENRGLTAHIMDVTRRLAKAGYVALAVDLLSRQGGTASVGYDQVPGALGNMPPEQFVEDFLCGWRFIQKQSFALASHVGMVGFCFGGGVTWRAATHMPELRAAVPFYGPHPPVEDVPRIQAAVLAIYGGLDQRINQGIPPIEEAMRMNNKIYEKVIYPGANHAFHNDTSPRYNAEAARDAWSRTLDWFGRYLAS